ncbi:uncharacterized protein LOC109851186 [Asparagus officinalis]|uniref:uncharacterized protein LOC109851186 n=1 Tax=Asparagus officinalis TaxID=4686 RepID=UPI00098E1352|nr:uncharacterized protein LOC109851186 [Asparagus officinalis]
MGEDQSCGDFAKDVYGKFLTIDIPDEFYDDNDQVDVEPENANAQPNEGNVNLPPTNNYLNCILPTTSNVKTSSKKKGSKSSNDDDLMCNFVETMSYSIQNQNMINWTEKLSKALNAHAYEFFEIVLDKIFDHLHDNQHEARRIIGKTKEARKRYVTKLIDNEKFDDND